MLWPGGGGGGCGNFLLCVGVESSYVGILLLLLCPVSINQLTRFSRYARS